MLVHTDYHLSDDDLCSVVTGPTFVVTHDFTDNDVGLYYQQDGVWRHGRAPNGVQQRREADVMVSGPYVTMATAGGSVYGPHLFRSWIRGDCYIASRNGGSVCSYIGQLGSSRLYFLCPAAGRYPIRRSGPDRTIQESRVIRSDEIATTTPTDTYGDACHGFNTYHDENSSAIRFATTGRSLLKSAPVGAEDILPRAELDGLALQLAAVQRNEKFDSHCINFITARLSSQNLEPDSIVAVCRWVIQRSEHLRISGVSQRWFQFGGSPWLSPFTAWVVRCFNLTSSLASRARFAGFLHVLAIRYRLLRFAVPWSFPTVYIPGYCNETRPDGEVGYRAYSNRPFYFTCPPTYTAIDNKPHPTSRQMPIKHAKFDQGKSDKNPASNKPSTSVDSQPEVPCTQLSAGPSGVHIEPSAPPAEHVITPTHSPADGVPSGTNADDSTAGHQLEGGVAGPAGTFNTTTAERCSSGCVVEYDPGYYRTGHSIMVERVDRSICGHRIRFVLRNRRHHEFVNAPELEDQEVRHQLITLYDSGTVTTKKSANAALDKIISRLAPQAVDQAVSEGSSYETVSTTSGSETVRGLGAQVPRRPAKRSRRSKGKLGKSALNQKGRSG